MGFGLGQNEGLALWMMTAGLFSLFVLARDVRGGLQVVERRCLGPRHKLCLMTVLSYKTNQT